MSRTRLVLPGALDSLQTGSLVELAADRVHYLRNVLRLRVGATVELLDGSAGRAFTARIEELRPSGGTVRILDGGRAVAEPPVLLTLLVGLPRGDRFERVVRTATLLGAARLRAVQTRRSVPVVRGERVEGRLRRWMRVAEEAARLAGRACVPDIGSPLPLPAALDTLGDPCSSLRLMPYEEAASTGQPLGEVLGAALTEGSPPPREVVLLTGPEGGFEPGEVALAARHGFRPVSLGPRVLPAEVAAEVAATIVLHRLGDLA